MVRLTEVVDKIPDKDDQPVLDIRAEVQKVIGDVLRVAQASQQLTAPVLIPTAASMRVHLVPAHHLDHLEEYRSNQNIMFAAAFLFLGADIGVIVNVATGGKMEAAAGVILLAFLLVAALFGWFGWQALSKGDALKRRLLQEAGTPGGEQDSPRSGQAPPHN
jgi:hypothetical protein